MTSAEGASEVLDGRLGESGGTGGGCQVLYLRFCGQDKEGQ